MGDKEIRYVPIAEVKNMLQKLNKERKELLYEQRIALEHAQKFGKISVKKANDMIKELTTTFDFLEEYHATKISDLLPETPDDIKAIFAKERITSGDEEINKILEIVNKYYIK